MLISYPVLPAAAVHDDEDIYLANVLEGHLLQYEGIYPVSTMATTQGPMHRWHGGVHLHGGGEPIRAIADGTVVACRFAAQAETYGTLGAYDTSFVLLRHETQTGENTTVVFYSLYMHLANQSALAADRLTQLPTWLRRSPGTAVQRPANQRVWRKDVLGFAGQLYNREAMHFEVFMLDADFQRVWRDSSSATQGTGSADWFGDAHFVIPAQQQFAERHPRAATSGAHRIDFAGPADFALPLGLAGQNDRALYVSVSLRRGRRITTTYRAGANGGYEQVGHPVVQDDYEYEIYRLATALYPDCPSAGLEWLRFGRVLGPDATTRNENWQLVRYSDSAIGYIDLAPQTIAKLSDADFPHWHGWEKRDEGETTNASDGICDDARTLELVQAARGNDAATHKLQHLICKAPSEWDDTDLAARYARLREPGQSLESDDSWRRFAEHVGKLAFWASSGLSERSVWHFHPLQFVRHYRNCLWLSQNEMRQLVPMKAVRGQGAGMRGPFFYERVGVNGGALVAAHHVVLNRTWRKYVVTTHARLASFVGNSVQETQWWSTTEEGNGSNLRYAPWYGRGFLQLTNPNGQFAVDSNYGRYFAFRGRAITGATDAQIADWRDNVADRPYDAADSAGTYWSWNKANAEADVVAASTRRVITLAPRSQVMAGRTIGIYENAPFRRVACLINLPGAINRADPQLNGLVDRYTAYANAQVVLFDTPRFPSAQGRDESVPEDFSPRRP